MLKWVRPDSEVERTEAVLENLLRWEDDGDKTLCISNTHEQ